MLNNPTFRINSYGLSLGVYCSIIHTYLTPPIYVLYSLQGQFIGFQDFTLLLNSRLSIFPCSSCEDTLLLLTINKRLTIKKVLWVFLLATPKRLLQSVFLFESFYLKKLFTKKFQAKIHGHFISAPVLVLEISSY